MSINAPITFSQAIGYALRDAMSANDRVILMGQDIGAAGGPFGVTQGLSDRFGKQRVLDFPISEASLVGAALGAALTGYRPVAEIMFMDFSTLAMDALVNQSAKTHFMFGGRNTVPLVVRMPHGGGISAGAQHSQCLESWFAHVPGLYVVCPSNAADAYGLLRASIDNPNPVIFIENKSLYAAASRLPKVPEAIPLGSARIARAGRDATVVSYGASVHWAEQSAAELALSGIDIEVIDLRSLQPWDETTIFESLAKTHRLVVCHEAVEAFGIGAEIAARMAEIGFDELHAPIRRVGAPFCPVPYAPTLETEYAPNPAKLTRVLREILLR